MKNRTVNMRTDLAGLAKSAADCIEDMSDRIREWITEAAWEEFSARFQPLGTAFALRELSNHATETANGEHTVDEFAKHYCLKPENYENDNDPT